jgi:hypothetical protein
MIASWPRVRASLTAGADLRAAAGTVLYLTLIALLSLGATIGVNSLPLTPWQGLGVAALWTAGAVLLGALLLRFRDA